MISFLQELHLPFASFVVMLRGCLFLPAVFCVASLPVDAAGSGSLEWLIVPGKSLAKLKLGMSVRDIVITLGPPSVKQKDSLEYWSRDKQHFVIAFIQKDKMVEAMFSSPKFRTEDGLNTGNFDQPSNLPQFNSARLKWNNLNLKYGLRQGGLDFYVVNADAYAEHDRMRMGVVYSGTKAPFPVIARTDLPDSGWQTWNGNLADVHKGLVESESGKPLETNYPGPAPVFSGIWPGAQETPLLAPPEGSWSWSAKSGGPEMNLEIRVQGNKVSGGYHAVTHNADRLDEGDIHGVWSGNHASLKFKSENFGGHGAGELVLYKNKLFWRKTESENSEESCDCLPAEAVLEKHRK